MDKTYHSSSSLIEIHSLNGDSGPWAVVEQSPSVEESQKSCDQIVVAEQLQNSASKASQNEEPKQKTSSSSEELSLYLRETSDFYRRYVNKLRRNNPQEKFIIPIDMFREQIMEYFQITDLQNLSSGGFGTVYSAKDESGKQFAVKVMTTRYDDPIFIGDIFKRRYQREVIYLSKLTSHPNIVDYYDSTLLCDNKIAAIKMELLNCSLLDHAKGNPVPITICTEILKQIGSAVLYMHEHLFAHHDIKLENIGVRLQQVAANEHPLVNATFKLLDFGLARFYSVKRMLETTQGGTHFYMPYEKAFYTKPYDPFLADSFSLGVTLAFASLGAKVWQIMGECKMRLGDPPTIVNSDNFLEKCFHNDDKNFRLRITEGNYRLNMQVISRGLLEQNSSRLNFGEYDKEFATDFENIVKAMLNREIANRDKPARISIAVAIERCELMLSSAIERQLKCAADKKGTDNERNV